MVVSIKEEVAWVATIYCWNWVVQTGYIDWNKAFEGFSLMGLMSPNKPTHWCIRTYIIYVDVPTAPHLYESWCSPPSPGHSGHEGILLPSLAIQRWTIPIYLKYVSYPLGNGYISHRKGLSEFLIFENAMGVGIWDRSQDGSGGYI